MQAAAPSAAATPPPHSVPSPSSLNAPQSAAAAASSASYLKGEASRFMLATASAAGRNGSQAEMGAVITARMGATLASGRQLQQCCPATARLQAPSSLPMPTWQRHHGCLGGVV